MRHPGCQRQLALCLNDGLAPVSEVGAEGEQHGDDLGGHAPPPAESRTTVTETSPNASSVGAVMKPAGIITFKATASIASVSQTRRKRFGSVEAKRFTARAS